MKICRTFLFLLFAVLLTSSISAQTITSFDLTIFKPLPEVDLVAFYESNSLSGAPRVFQISILPAGIDVVLEGEISWTNIGETSSKRLSNFETMPFKSTTFNNTDLGTQIRINEARTNNDNNGIRDLVQKYGKPIGRFDINLTLKNSQGVTLKQVSDYVEFINPTQSFSIEIPQSGEEFQLGNILVQWSNVPGADHYEVKINELKSHRKSFEEALNSGNPYYNNIGIQNSITSIRLSEQDFNRPIETGKEYVVQVVAVIKLATGDRKLSSEIINFRTAGFYDANKIAIKNELMTLTSLPGFSTFASIFSDQNLVIDQLVDENGNPISQDELRTLLNYFIINPDVVIQTQFIYNNNQ
ncbi:MAG: hypothetical protein M0P61_10825 [Ignavibacteriaceae bacterium]|jgi:hypothetical protein|nr:hypothetical protein [Ignavibacteriaceae bacterium]